MMKELIEFISRYDAGYAGTIRGASAGEVSELERLVGRRLPGRYQEFLRHMGRSMGDFVVPETNFLIDRILRFYRGKARDRIPQRYIFIAAHEEDPYSSYYYDCGSSAEADDYKIIRAELGEDFANADMLSLAFPSLQDMLFLFAFQVKRMYLLPHRAFLQTSWGTAAHEPGEAGTLTLEGLEGIMPQLGFQRLPYTSVMNPLFDRADAAFYAHRASDTGGLSAELAASHEKEHSRLLEIIKDNTLLT
ncbi:SMI1/KNR4 family protein [Hyalangium gracile]|uniref:SMI1/KNR4 family protein n=1 Tax=Hyalangium gracile TaxID=394092 RepID=UPI001CCDBFDF|nr:SMI1/KNR4 family protein [Hyalangium gracile]